MPIKLPPGVSAGTFASAVKEFQAALGVDWVFTTEEDLEAYRDAYSIRWGHEDEFLASAAVAPANVEQVQSVVRVANKYRIPLYPIATGKNLAYGGSAPGYSGSVVLDMKRMNRVLEVDENRAFALVEPGCSYFDLYRHIKDRGLKVWIDCPDPGWGSPIGNALDHGNGYTASPFRDHWGAHCGMEVVLPTGEVMRTGMGALPNATTWQEYKDGVGPNVDGLFSQGNFGIVTKMGFWLMPQPEATLTGVVSVPKYSDLGELINHCNYLADSHLATGQVVYSSPLNGQGGGPELQALLAQGWPTVEQLDALAAQKRLPAWRVRLQFYGPEKTCRANWEYAQERISRTIPGATYSDVDAFRLPLTPEQEKSYHLSYYGIPSMQVFRIMARTPNDADPKDGHADFYAVISRTAEAVHASLKVLYETQRQMGVKPTTVTPFQGPLDWHHKSFFIGAPMVPTYRDKPERNREGRVLYDAYLKNMSAAGFAPYRTNTGSQTLLAQQFSFNNNALLRFQEALKDAADPNGILAPGRYGVWPKRLRNNRA